MLDLSQSPPEEIFYNRMSASSHTREYRYTAEYTASILAWLEGHNRKVINTSRALQLEVSKVLQYSSLNAYKIHTPRTVAAVGVTQKPKFKIIEDFTNTILEKYASFLEANNIHIAGIEFITDEQGDLYTYDINTNTNYNSDAETVARMSGVGRIAKYLGNEFKNQY